MGMYEFTDDLVDLQWDLLLGDEGEQHQSEYSSGITNREKREEDRAAHNYIYLQKVDTEKVTNRREWMRGIDRNNYDVVFRDLSLSHTSKRHRDQGRALVTLLNTLSLAFQENGVVICPTSSKHNHQYCFSMDYAWDVIKALEQSGYVNVIRGLKEAWIPHKIEPSSSKCDLWKSIYQEVHYKPKYLSLKGDDKEPLALSEHNKLLNTEYEQFKAYKDFMLEHEVLDANNKKVSLYGLHRQIKLIDGNYLYGRIHGSRHIHMRKADRRWLSIDNEAVASIDISCAYPQLLYMMVGKQLDGDAYELKVGVERSTLKRILSQMICSNSERGLITSIIKLNEVKDTEHARFIVDSIKSKHSAISEMFFKDMSSQLFRKESDLVMSVMSECISNGMPVINVHDELICKDSDKEEVLLIMKKYIPLVTLSSMDIAD